MSKAEFSVAVAGFSGAEPLPVDIQSFVDATAAIAAQTGATARPAVEAMAGSNGFVDKNHVEIDVASHYGFSALLHRGESAAGLVLHHSRRGSPAGSEKTLLALREGSDGLLYFRQEDGNGVPRIVSLTTFEGVTADEFPADYQIIKGIHASLFAARTRGHTYVKQEPPDSEIPPVNTDITLLAGPDNTLKVARRRPPGRSGDERVWLDGSDYRAMADTAEVMRIMSATVVAKVVDEQQFRAGNPRLSRRWSPRRAL